MTEVGEVGGWCEVGLHEPSTQFFCLRPSSFPPKCHHVTRHASFRRSGLTLNIKPLGPYTGPFGQSKHSNWLMPRVWNWALEMGRNIKCPFLVLVSLDVDIM